MRQEPITESLLYELSDYYETAKWQKKRSDRLRIDCYTCQICGSRRNLQVHHITYRRVFDEDVFSDLITLCGRCHSQIEELKKSDTTEDFIVTFTDFFQGDKP